MMFTKNAAKLSLLGLTTSFALGNGLNESKVGALDDAKVPNEGTELRLGTYHQISSLKLLSVSNLVVGNNFVISEPLRLLDSCSFTTKRSGTQRFWHAPTGFFMPVSTPEILNYGTNYAYQVGAVVAISSVALPNNTSEVMGKWQPFANHQQFSKLTNAPAFVLEVEGYSAVSTNTAFIGSKKNP